MTSAEAVSNALSFLAQASPLILAALGGLISEYAGLLNIGLEGIMLGGAFAGIWGASLFPDPVTGFVMGFLIAIIFGFLAGKLMATITLRGRANVFIVGLAINLLASGIVSIAGKVLFATRSVIIWEHVLNPVTVRIIFVAGSVVALGFLWIFVRSTRTGLRLRVLGSDPDMLEARGVNIYRLKNWALTLSGVCAALAGAALSLQLGAFVPNQSAGKGWIALVLVFVGGRNPLGILAACLLFVATENIATAAQAWVANPALMVGLPFMLVLVALMIVQGLRRAARKRLH